ncbi:BQ5605_C001g00457 [Microbotryum silenes-dioicae]|uniref:BQ5605_C001g00457 protein n=1 Tax=Microbotryum silenes-dioicae TaxID=796604 RepID=A0A2X0M7J9_9BASI|nr:BQ5605_C001g00457 [Microbotryum silenes-dioicae]
MHAMTPFAAATPPAFSPPPGASPAPFRPSPAVRASLPLPHAPSGGAPGGGTAATAPNRSHRAPSIMSTSRMSGLPSSFDEPVLEARKVVALLNGVEGQSGSGMLARLEQECQVVFEMYGRAYEEGYKPDPTALQNMLSTMQHLLSTLQSSAVGGYPLAAASSADSSSMTPSALATRIEQASSTVRDLFKERMRVKEGAEIVRNVLSS